MYYNGSNVGFFQSILLKIMYLDLSTFKDSLFAVSPKAIFDSSKFTVLITSDNVLPAENTLVSPANVIGNIGTRLVTFDIPLMSCSDTVKASNFE